MSDKNTKVREGESPDLKQQPKMPKIDFSTFIFSLNSSALFHLGVIGEPESDRRIKDLVLAKQTIDILGMIEEKTKGNLSDDEANLLKNILHDLRLMYVREKEGKQQ